jgi:hypothetical protein
MVFAQMSFNISIAQAFDVAEPSRRANYRHGRASCRCLHRRPKASHQVSKAGAELLCGSVVVENCLFSNAI